MLNKTQDHINLEDIQDEMPATEKGFSCLDRWKNAGPKSHKHMFALFNEIGIFIASCCHQMMLYTCGMIQSSELLY